MSEMIYLIKEENKGKFTEWCKSNGFKKVNCSCICKALKSIDKHLRQEANFAYNFGFKKNGKVCKCVEDLRNMKKK